MKLLCKLLFVIFIMAVFDYGWAATYYVDYKGGIATALGTSTATAWKYCPGDSRFAAACAGNCATIWTGAGSKLNAGDKVIFKGDVTYAGSAITTSWGGSADDTAHRIIYDGDSGTYVARWGSGTSKATIDGEATRAGFLNVSAGAYVTINSFEIKNGATHRADFGGGVLIFNYSGANNVTISNNTVHDVGNFVGTGGTVTGTCIASDGADYFRVQNNTVYNCGYTGIMFWPATVHGSNLEISGNNVTDKVAWGIAAAFAGQANVTSWKIFNNTVHDLVYYAVGDDPHTNFIWLFGSGNYGVTDIEIYNNLLYTDGTAQPSSGAIHLEAPHGGFNNVKIYNNVLKNISYVAPIYLTTRNADGNGIFKDVYIYNNSIHQPSSGGGGGIGIFPSATGAYTNVNIKNNIFSIRAPANGYVILLPMSKITGLTIDYNLYYLATSTPFDCNDAINNWADFKTCTGNAERHSVGLTSDPLYTDIGATSHDLRLSSTSSPAYNAGADLSATIGSLDFMGNTRPQGASWDIGAYQHNTPKPPLNLKILSP
jgi:hypothetical protein